MENQLDDSTVKGPIYVSRSTRSKINLVKSELAQSLNRFVHQEEAVRFLLNFYNERQIRSPGTECVNLTDTRGRN